MKLNIINKIWQQHVVKSQKNFPDILYIDRILLHEVTSAQAFAELRLRNLPIRNKQNIIATINHNISTNKNRMLIHDEVILKQANSLRQNCREQGLSFYDIGSNYQGIVHVIGPELGFTLPGKTIICGDSHTSTHGAFGALAFGVGTTEITHAMATNCILQDKPKTCKIEFKGLPNSYFTAKDAILKLIATIGIGGAKGCIIEYVGNYIKSLSIEARMTICNMSIECGARAGLVAPDEVTFEYLKDRTYTPKAKDWEKAKQQWRQLASDEGAIYDKEITINIENTNPMITWGINPEHAIALTEKTPPVDARANQVTLETAYSYTKLTPGQSLLGTPIDYAFVGSCTNGRIEDLRAVARILAGRKVASNVTLCIVPGSEQVLAQAKAEKLDKIFAQAGAELRMPGCSMCVALSIDKVPAGNRCISTTNRNFIGRQGPNTITHLASPQTVAASAVLGVIAMEQDVKLNNKKPRIYLIATGGTIAGVTASPQIATYNSQNLRVTQLLKSAPGIDKIADLRTFQLFNKGSYDLLLSDWLVLTKKISQLLDDPKNDGIVITHGTDTLEETAYFLNLTVKSHKPVILVGAMRPATILSPDGPSNLYNASCNRCKFFFLRPRGASCHE